MPVRFPSVARLVRRAGIYLHTHTLEQPFSSPISICESMATGAYVLVPRCPASALYGGDAVESYSTIDEAESLLRATLDWPESEWRRREKVAVDRAFGLFEATVAIQPVLRAWSEATGRRFVV